MTLVRFPKYDIQADYEWSIPGVIAYVDTQTGEIYNHALRGDGENGFYYVDVPTGKFTEFVNTTDSSGRLVYGTHGYNYAGGYRDPGTGDWVAIGNIGANDVGEPQLGDWLSVPRMVAFFNQNNVIPAYDPVYGWVMPRKYNYGELMTRYRNMIYTGGDFISNTFFDSGAAVMGLMVAVGYLAFTGAGIGVANEVTQAIQTGGSVATDTATTVVNAGEQAAQTIAQNTELLTTPEGNVIDASLTQTPGVTTTPYVDYSLQPWQVTPLAPVPSINLPQTPNVPQPAQTPPTPTPAEQAAKVLKDQAIKIATGGASTLLKTLTGGNSNAVAPRGYVRNPQTGELTPAPQSDSVLPLAVIAALLMFS